jgi:hypothetical protein
VDGKIPNDQWGVPLSHTLILSRTFFIRLADEDECALHSYVPLCWRFQSSVWGEGVIVTRCSKLKRIYDFFVSNRCFLANFFHENFFRDFTGLDWFDPVDSSSNTTCSFCWFFLFVFFFFGGGRWEVGGLSQDELFGDYSSALLQFGRYLEVRSTAFSFLVCFFCRELIGMLLKQ